MARPLRRFHQPASQSWSARGNELTLMILRFERSSARGRFSRIGRRVAAYNSATVAPALLMSERAPFPDDPFPLLEHGTIEGIELIPWGSNYTFAALLRGADGTNCYGVYKPRRGEVPLRDFPSGTLYKREVAAYVFSQHLGWDLVPPTIVREDGPHGIGSLQLYVEPCTDARAP